MSQHHYRTPRRDPLGFPGPPLASPDLFSIGTDAGRDAHHEGLPVPAAQPRSGRPRTHPFLSRRPLEVLLDRSFLDLSPPRLVGQPEEKSQEEPGTGADGADPTRHAPATT